MESLINEFLNIQPIENGDGSGYGYGSGDGSGDGSGSGSGDGSGYGYGSGSGSGDGSGYGYGSGYGDGSGSGSGDGSGYGYGSGDGSGYGYGDGSGYGYGDGSGDGSGYGYGSGDGSGYGLKIKTESKIRVNVNEYKKGFLGKETHGLKKLNGHPVYYIDNIPCVFLSVVGNVAKVNIINDDFSLKRSYIAKSYNLFAHGDTKAEALQDVSNKYYSSLSFEDKKQEFLNTFKSNVSYEASMFYVWHHLLTGSCKSGRDMFIKSRGINLNSDMTVQEFISLTESEYNGTVIRELKSHFAQ